MPHNDRKKLAEAIKKMETYTCEKCMEAVPIKEFHDHECEIIAE